MKFAGFLGLFLAAQGASAHYIFNTLIAGSKTSTQAVRQPPNNSPVLGVSNPGMTCNVNLSPARETVTVAPGDTIGFKLSNNMYHKGPAAIYLGKAPGAVENWDGSGQAWFKIAEWGPLYDGPQLSFTSLDMTEFTTTIPKNTPPGDYLLRAEQIALHLTGAPENFMSCAQIRITGNGNGNPPMVSIPGYVSPSDPSIMVNIYQKVNSYTCPGPAVWRG
ncbi:glycoside hydrolase [Panaeolus papilionaceus]|nr:glycoside hydrolase [Panaeolus papilionaceus]